MSKAAPVKLDAISSITTFGDLLRYLRQRAQLTQRDLALAVGYSISQISRLEHNERLPDEITLLSLFVPALGLEQEPATVERLLTLACQARGEAATPPASPATTHETIFSDPATPPPTPKLTNLPHRLTSFIGREQEVATLQWLVQEHRLVTLTGVGGVGKSSLALALGQAILDLGLGILDLEAISPSNNPKSKIKNQKFPDGVWLLELAPLTEGGLVARALADLFKLPEFPGRTSLEAVIAYLQSKALLLIIDNCEHLIATCADLVDRLLRTSATLHILATSREALNTAGEREWPVLPLATPPPTATVEAEWSLARLQPFAAAQLFIERVQALKAASPFTDQDAPLIAHLCQQLDGIPLALELAAARCKSLALAEIVARLQDRFALLSTGRRTALLRHQTLRATIDWSYDLLSAAEAALFRCLSVFVGGWTLAAAEQVAGRGQEYPPTFALLHQLVNKSLVIGEQRGATTRYRMLETIRQYAGEKLQEQGETETVRARHFAWCLALIEDALPTTLLGAPLGQWREDVKADLDNVRAAFSWSQTQNDQNEKSLRLATAIGPYWQFQEDISEGTAWLESALKHGDPENTELYSWGIGWLAYTLLLTSPRAFDLATEALQRFTALNQPDGMALANLVVGVWATTRGKSAKAINCLQAAVARFEAKPSLYFLDIAYLNLANALVTIGKREQALHYRLLWLQLGEELDAYGIACEALESIAMIDPSQAMALCQKQVAKHRQRQDLQGVAALLHTQGIILTFAGDLPGALVTLQESLALSQKLDILGSEWRSQAHACLELGLVQYRRQEYQQALVYAQQSVQLYGKTNNWHGVAMAHITVGYPSLALNDLPLALSSFHKCLQIAIGKDLDCTYLAVVGLAEVARRQENPVPAARLFGVAERFAQQINLVDDRWKEAFCQPLLTKAHTHLREAAYAAAWAEGQTMPLDQAMQLALTFADPRSNNAPTGRGEFIIAAN